MLLAVLRLRETKTLLRLTSCLDYQLVIPIGSKCLDYQLVVPIGNDVTDKLEVLALLL